MNAVCLHDRDRIAAFLQKDPCLHLYEIGDLDDFFWPYTTWYALQEGREIQQVVLIYIGMSLPVLWGLTRGPTERLGDLLRGIVPFLPRRIYTHLSEGALPALGDSFAAESHGVHYRMALTDPSRLAGVDTSEVTLLSPHDVHNLQQLYSLSYPGHWFDPRMLETGCYFGIRRGKAVISVAGIHVYSPRYRVAAIGNVTTHPQYRGQGLGTAVCSKLCQHLLETVDHVGLNVKTDNVAALACYHKLGFEIIAEYEELMLEARA